MASDDEIRIGDLPRRRNVSIKLTEAAPGAEREKARYSDETAPYCDDN